MRNKLIMLRWAVTSGLFTSFGIICHAQVMNEIAEPATLSANAPRYSDVVMRSLRFRDVDFEFGSTMQNVKDFHVTRLDWVYVREGDESFMKDFDARGIKVGGTINASPVDSSIAVQDIHGKAQEVPWLPGRYFICVNNPGAFKYNMENIKLAIDMGCVAVQRDEPGFGNVEYSDRCCFCRFCREKAKMQGIDLYDDAQRKAFNKECTMEYYKKLYGQANKYAGFELGHSCNGGARSWDDEKYREIFMEHDYRMAEMRDKTPGEVYLLSAETRARAKGQMFQYTTRGSMDKDIQRKYIAICYATGMNLMVPWDVYVSRAPRFFGSKEDYADLYGFIRCLGQAGYLDGYEDAAIGGYDLDETRYAKDPLGIISGNKEICMFARAIPGNADAPVVVHLVNWGGSGPVKIKLLTSSFFNGKALKLKLWSPKPYSASEHAVAEETGNFEFLKQDLSSGIKVTRNGMWTEVDLPEFSPWGILVAGKK